jgi:hypothetical protein
MNLIIILLFNILLINQSWASFVGSQKEDTSQKKDISCSFSIIDENFDAEQEQIEFTDYKVQIPEKYPVADVDSILRNNVNSSILYLKIMQKKSDMLYRKMRVLGVFSAAALLIPSPLVCNFDSQARCLNAIAFSIIGGGLGMGLSGCFLYNNIKYKEYDKVAQLIKEAHDVLMSKLDKKNLIKTYLLNYNNNNNNKEKLDTLARKIIKAAEIGLFVPIEVLDCFKDERLGSYKKNMPKIYRYLSGYPRELHFEREPQQIVDSLLKLPMEKLDDWKELFKSILHDWNSAVEKYVLAGQEEKQEK